MAWVKTAGSNASMGDASYGKKYAECTQGEVLIEGVFIKTGTDQFGKANYYFRKADGEVHCLNNAKKLDEAMEGVVIGTLTQVAYDGTFELTKGPYKGKAMHLFVVQTDESGSQPAAAPVVTVAATPDVATTPIVAEDPGPAVSPAASVAGADKADLLAKFRAAKG